MLILNSVAIVKGNILSEGYDYVKGISIWWNDSPISTEKCIDDKNYTWNDSPISNERCIDDQDYSCIDTVCKPEGYEKDKAPQNVSKVVGNILARYSRVQSIDVRRAMFSFTAKFVIVWQDPRLRFCNQTSTEALDDSLLGEIWTPQLKVRAIEFKDQHKSKSISQL